MMSKGQLAFLVPCLFVAWVVPMALVITAPGILITAFALRRD
jgi:hypothetical protein